LIQSLATKNYPEDFYKSFGIIISDEVHHLSSQVWSQMIVRFPARWRFGLTGTLKRRDKTERIFKWHLGKVLGEIETDLLIPKIRRIKTGWSLTKTPTFDPARLRKPIVLRIMVKDIRRNQLIVSELMKALEAKRQVLVLSERLNHLRILAEMFEKTMSNNGKKYTYDFYVGGITEEKLKEAQNKNVLFGSYQYSEEGSDLVPFSAVFLATPKVRVYQAIGRILRECPEKKVPIVTDFIDGDLYSRKFNFARLNLYKKRGWLSS